MAIAARISSAPPPTLRYQFNELRAAQAAAILIRLAGGQENYTKLLKLLYLADRESLLATGNPISGSSFVTMKAGPVLSDVYDCIKHEDRCPTWHQFIQKAGYDVRLTSEPGDSELSDFDVETLTNLYQVHAGRDYNAMIKFVHTLPEVDEVPDGCREPLPVERVLRGQGVSEDEIAELVSRNRYIASVDSWVEGQRSGNRSG
jgi:hypothetical protein